MTTLFVVLFFMGATAKSGDMAFVGIVCFLILCPLLHVGSKKLVRLLNPFTSEEESIKRKKKSGDDFDFRMEIVKLSRRFNVIGVIFIVSVVFFTGRLAHNRKTGIQGTYTQTAPLMVMSLCIMSLGHIILKFYS